MNKNIHTHVLWGVLALCACDSRMWVMGKNPDHRGPCLIHRALLWGLWAGYVCNLIGFCGSEHPPPFTSWFWQRPEIWPTKMLLKTKPVECLWSESGPSFTSGDRLIRFHHLKWFDYFFWLLSIVIGVIYFQNKSIERLNCQKGHLLRNCPYDLFCLLS